MSFGNERSVKAIRKSALCDACGKMVAAGSPAVRWAGTQDGDFYTLLYHQDCREAEVAWNRETGSFLDDWSSLCDLEWDDWPWLIGEFPEVAIRMGITMERHDEIKADQERCNAAMGLSRKQERPLP